MSFQFPANPKDGDVVVQPQQGGGFIKGTYIEATNTWAVGELPQEPGIPGPEGPKGDQGPQGDPGKGVAVSGIVPTYTDLDAPSNRYLQFWIVDDTNTLYFSDGFTWRDLGSPIQGPQGDGITNVTAEETSTTYVLTFEGTVPELNITTPNLKGANGTPGTDGADGKGWTGTTVDDSNNEYKITFESDDGLEFTTANLKGEKGDQGEPGQDFDGNIPLATTNSPGIVQIGDGIDVDTAGVISVDLETVDVNPGDDPVQPNNALYFQAGYWNVADAGTATTLTYSSNPGWTQNGTITVPSTSNGAIVYYFTGSGCNSSYTPPGGYGLQWTVYANLVNTVSITGNGVAFTAGGNSMGINTTHNFSVGSETRRSSSAPVTKIGQITYPFGTTSVNVSSNTRIQNFHRATVTGGRARVILVPYRDTNDTTRWNNMTSRERALYSTTGFDIDPDQIEGSDSYIEPPDFTQEEFNEMNAAAISQQMAQMLNLIDVATNYRYTSGSEFDLLTDKRQEILNLPITGGNAEEIQLLLDNIEAEIAPYIGFDFVFNQ